MWRKDEQRTLTDMHKKIHLGSPRSHDYLVTVQSLAALAGAYTESLPFTVLIWHLKLDFVPSSFMTVMRDGGK